VPVIRADMHNGLRLRSGKSNEKRARKSNPQAELTEKEEQKIHTKKGKPLALVRGLTSSEEADFPF